MKISYLSRPERDDNDWVEVFEGKIIPHAWRDVVAFEGSAEDRRTVVIVEPEEYDTIIEIFQKAKALHEKYSIGSITIEEDIF